MAIPLRKAIKSTCPLCGWSSVIWQNSDTLFLPQECKQCGGKKLDLSKAGMIETFFARRRYQRQKG
jgi:hypothetical protein